MAHAFVFGDICSCVVVARAYSVQSRHVANSPAIVRPWRVAGRRGARGSEAEGVVLRGGRLELEARVCDRRYEGGVLLLTTNITFNMSSNNSVYIIQLQR